MINDTLVGLHIHNQGHGEVNFFFLKKKSYFIKLWKYIKIVCVEVFYIQFFQLGRKQNHNQNVSFFHVDRLICHCAPFIVIRIMCFECTSGV